MAPDIPKEAVERFAPGLDGLEKVFRPLVAGIPLEAEPAYVLLLARERDA